MSPFMKLSILHAFIFKSNDRFTKHAAHRDLRHVHLIRRRYLSQQSLRVMPRDGYSRNCRYILRVFEPLRILVRRIAWGQRITRVSGKVHCTAPLYGGRVTGRAVRVWRVTVLNGDITVISRVRRDQYTRCTEVCCAFDLQSAEDITISHYHDLAIEVDTFSKELLVVLKDRYEK